MQCKPYYVGSLSARGHSSQPGGVKQSGHIMHTAIAEAPPWKLAQECPCEVAEPVRTTQSTYIQYVRTYVHTYVCKCIYTYTFTYICTYIHHAHTSCTHTYVNTVCMYVHAYSTYTHINAYIHTYVHTYIHTYIHTHIHTYIHTYVRTYVHVYMY